MKPLERFISDLKELCKANDFDLRLHDSKTINLGGRFVSGYLDPSDKILACAMKHPQAYTIIFHESCHMDQFIEKSPIWKDDDADIDKWLDGKNYVDADVVKMLANNKWLELDCEKRAVRKLKKYQIPFNEKEYIQKANAYVQFYNFIWYSRRWCTKKNTPYANKDIWSEMPDTFMPKSWYETIGDYELSVFIKSRI